MFIVASRSAFRSGFSVLRSADWVSRAFYAGYAIGCFDKGEDRVSMNREVALGKLWVWERKRWVVVALLWFESRGSVIIYSLSFYAVGENM